VVNSYASELRTVVSDLINNGISYFILILTWTTTNWWYRSSTVVYRL